MSGTSRNGSRSANGENAPNPEVVGKAKRRRFSSANQLRIEPIPVSRTHLECRRMSGHEVSWENKIDGRSARSSSATRFSEPRLADIRSRRSRANSGSIHR